MSLVNFKLKSTSSTVANSPTITSLQQISLTTVRVMWSPPSGGATVTGYVVHYRTCSCDGNQTFESSASTSTDITGLTDGLIYTISVEATSQHPSGKSEEMTISLSNYICYIYTLLLHGDVNAVFMV